MDVMRCGVAMKFTASVDDMFIISIEPVGELVLAEIRPDVFDRVELRARWVRRY